MKAITLSVFAVLAGALATTGATAGAEATFNVRNDSGMTLACVTWPAGTSRRADLTISPGQEWTLQAKAKTRFLTCSPSRQALRLKLAPGQRYRLVHDRTSGNILLLAA